MSIRKIGVVGVKPTMAADDIDLDKAFGVASEGYLQHVKHITELNELKYSHLTNKEREAIIVDVRNTPKINRNSKCICGSGKKYKKCCIKN